MQKTFLLSVLILAHITLCAQAVLQGKMNGLLLKTIAGKNLRVQLSNTKPTAIVFLSPECPLSQNYSLTLNNLKAKFEENVDFIGIFTGSGYAFAEYKNFQSKYNTRFALLVDVKNKLAKLVAATTTPEVVLFDKDNVIIYQGAIDDWAVSPGRQRASASDNYLQNAIENYLRAAPVKVKKTTPVGCRINFK